MFYPPKPEGPAASDVAQRLGLHHLPGRNEWRGDCPICAYRDTLALTQRLGRPLLYCHNCHDRDGLSALLRGAGVTPMVPDPSREAERGAKRQRTHDAMLRLWASGEALPGTPAEHYLRRRGIEHLAGESSLRFRGDTPHPSAAHLQAMLAAIVDVGGAMVAVHRTFLTLDGRKARAEPVKASLGPVAGGAIRIGLCASEIVVGEGIESSAAAGRLLALPAWSAISCGNLARHLVLPPEVARVVIAADHDPPGIEAAEAAARRWRAEGRHVRIALPNREGDDFADVLARRDGAIA